MPAAAGLDTAGMLGAAAAGDLDVLVLLGADLLSDFPMAARCSGPRIGGHRDRHRSLPVRRPWPCRCRLARRHGTGDGTFTNLEVGLRLRAEGHPARHRRADWMSASNSQPASAQISASIRQRRSGPNSPRFSAVHAPPEEALAVLEEGVLLAGSSLDGPVASTALAPANDAYSLRLVAGRRMYDAGTMVQASPSSAGLAATATVRLNPVDFDKLGIEAGTDVKVVSGQGELRAPLAVDPGVPAGSAVVPANAPGNGANILIDASAPVTDVRVERA